MIACDLEALFHDAMGELHGPERRALQEHLRACAACRLERENWLGFVGRTRSIAKEEIAAIPKFPGPFALRRTALETVAGVAAVALLAIGLLQFGTGGHNLRSEYNALAKKLRASQDEDGSWAGRVGSTALATLALLESSGANPRAEDRERIENAVHFLTQPHQASSEEELLRGLALLREKRNSGAPRNPQLQRAIDFAAAHVDRPTRAQAAPLLRELSAQARRAGLDSREADRQLGSLVSTSRLPISAETNWISISDSLSRKSSYQEAIPSLRLAASLLALGSPSR